jgi:putative ABC transport system permease protein
VSGFSYALRQLLKSPGFTAIAILTLALGIGANTAIFSVINAVLLQPLPYPEAGRIMTLHEHDSEGPEFAVSLPDYLDWKRDNTVFENLALYRTYSLNLSGITGRPAEPVSSALVTANFFKVAGLNPELGRTFTAEEDKNGAPPLVVIGDALWTRAFARDPNVLGRAVTFHEGRYTIIGVMPPQMRGPTQTEAWFSLMRRDNEAWENRMNHPLMYGWGRLKPGVTVGQARAQMSAIAARLEKQYPESNKNVHAVVTPLLENLVGKYRTNLAFLLGAVGLVLLVACVNLANLLAARGAARAREFAIRAALGASRGQIVRQLLLESGLLALAGSLAGFILAMWGRDAIVALSPADVARFQKVEFDLPVLLFTLLLAGTTTLLFGLLPAWQSARVDLQLALQAGGPRSSDSRGARRLRDWLVIGEVALTLVLLSAAGILLKSFAQIQSVPLGYAPRGLLSAQIDLPFGRYRTVEKVADFSEKLLRKVTALPGVEHAATGGTPPLFTPWLIRFIREGKLPPPKGQEPDTETETISSDYFATMGATLLRGRALDARDNEAEPPVVVIDQTMATQFFPNEDPIGKRLLMNPDDRGDRWFQIVGVVARMKFRGFDDAVVHPVTFLSRGQMNRQSLVLFVRSTLPPAALEKSIRAIVASIDPDQPVFDFRSMFDRVGETWAAARFLSTLLLIFAGLALALSTIGLYGVLAYSTVRRSREMGVRMALGARSGQILTLILGHGLRLLLFGLTIGLTAAFCCSQILRGFVFETSPFDPAIYAGAGFLLALAALVACWLPARRATRVDPVIALRAE